VGGDSGLEAVSPAPVFLVKVGPSLPEKKDEEADADYA